MMYKIVSVLLILLLLSVSSVCYADIDFGGFFNQLLESIPTATPTSTPMPTDKTTLLPYESFEIHNGTHFHMSYSQVKKLEQAAGVIFQEGKDTYRPYKRYYGYCTLAGIENSSIHYVFNNDKLVQCQYWFYQKDVTNKLEKGLQTKYGDASEYYGALGEGYVEAFKARSNSIYSVSQRLIPLGKIGDTVYYLAIDHHIDYSISQNGTERICYTLIDIDDSSLDDQSINDL